MKQNAAATPSHPTSAAFQNWFGASTVTDAQGRPLVVYHGTPKGGFKHFRVPAFFTSSLGDVDWYHQGNDDDAETFHVYLSLLNPFVLDGKDTVLRLIEIARSAGIDVSFEDGPHGWSFQCPEVAKVSDADGEGMPFHLLLIPRMVDALSALGYDGMTGLEPFTNYEIMVYAAFNATQIKSATDNSGAYSGASTHINE